jgi:hypothetical protein
MFDTPYNGTKQAKAFVLNPKKSMMTAMVRNGLAVAERILVGYAPIKSLSTIGLGGLSVSHVHGFPKPPRQSGLVDLGCP